MRRVLSIHLILFSLSRRGSRSLINRWTITYKTITLRHVTLDAISEIPFYPCNPFTGRRQGNYSFHSNQSCVMMFVHVNSRTRWILFSNLYQKQLSLNSNKKLRICDFIGRLKLQSKGYGEERHTTKRKRERKRERKSNCIHIKYYT